MKNICIAAFTCLIGSSAFSADRAVEIYCFQSTPAASHGIIINSMELRVRNQIPTVTINSMGLGLLTQDGDGTGNDMISKNLQNKVLLVDNKLSAKSSAWKQALPFAVKYKVQNAIRTLFIPRAAFTTATDFKARIKEDFGTKQSNFILTCNRL